MPSGGLGTMDSRVSDYIASDRFRGKVQRVVRGAFRSVKHDHGAEFKESTIKRVIGQLLNALEQDAVMTTAVYREDTGDRSTSGYPVQ